MVSQGIECCLQEIEVLHALKDCPFTINVVDVMEDEKKLYIVQK